MNWSDRIGRWFSIQINVTIGSVNLFGGAPSARPAKLPRPGAAQHQRPTAARQTPQIRLANFNPEPPNTTSRDNYGWNKIVRELQPQRKTS